MLVSHAFISKEFFAGKVKFFTAAFLVFIIMGVVFGFSSTVYAVDKMAIPDLAGIRPFSQAVNYMSLEGFVIYCCRVNYGVEISRSQAAKMIMAKETGYTSWEQTGTDRKHDSSKKNRFHK